MHTLRLFNNAEGDNEPELVDSVDSSDIVSILVTDDGRLHVTTESEEFFCDFAEGWMS